MPITKGAAKKLRQDERHQKQNALVRQDYKKSIRDLKKKLSQEELQKLYSALDTAAKKGVIHKNKAARLKSRLSRRVKKTVK